MDVKEIIAGNQIVISGNKISLDDIKQRDDADGMLIISPGGADADEPIESFNIKNINTGNGVRFDKLWVKNADLHVDSGRFYIDKLAVVDVAISAIVICGRQFMEHRRCVMAVTAISGTTCGK